MPTPPEMMDTVLRHIARVAGERREPVTLDPMLHNHVTGGHGAGDLAFTLKALKEREWIERAGRSDIPQYQLTMDGYEHLAQVNPSKAPTPEGGNAADLDPLTGLWNRGAFDRDLAEMILAASADAPLSFVMIDVDHFKQVNDDNGGHAAGDAALKEIAVTLRNVTSGKGNSYRFGGDEMALLLPNHSSNEAVGVAERARIEIERAAIPGYAFRVTATLGVATCPEHAREPKSLFEAGDKALYDAKHLGRNLVRIHGEPDTPPETGPATKAPKRRAPEPGGLSDEEGQKIRLDYFRNGVARCPKDQTALKVTDTSTYEETGALMVHCRFCGLIAGIDGVKG